MTTTIVKDDAYYKTQTCPELAKLLIDKVPLVNGDVVLEPFRGEGAFYDNLPTFVHKDWCEIMEGRNFVDYDKRVDWIVSSPPATLPDFLEDDNTSLFFKICNYWASSDLVRKGFCFLVNAPSYLALTPKRLEVLKNYGFTLKRQIVVNVKEFKNRSFFIIFGRSTIKVKEPHFDYLLGYFLPFPNPNISTTTTTENAGALDTDGDVERSQEIL